MEWLLKFPSARAAYEQLQSSSLLEESDALEVARRKLRNFPAGTRQISAGDEANRQVRHELFQFQHNSVDVLTTDKYVAYAEAQRRGHPDDLAGALGGFSFYAAIGKAEIEHLQNGFRVAHITHVDFYMKNPYSFYDDPSKGDSQYLGHWNKWGVILSKFSFAASKVQGLGALDSKSKILASTQSSTGWAKNPVAMGVAPAKEQDIYYPVRNVDFRNWQMKHQQGGDMLLFSDMERVRLQAPIIIRL